MRAVLGLPIPEITLERAGASAVVLAHTTNPQPEYSGLQEACSFPKSDLKIFGKPSTRPYRRMAVALAYDVLETDVKSLVEKAKSIASLVKVG